MLKVLWALRVFPQTAVRFRQGFRCRGIRWVRAICLGDTSVSSGEIHQRIHRARQGEAWPAELFIGVLPHVGSGKLNALAIANAQRSPLAPDLPTMAESGVPGVEGGTWYGVLAPRGTPQSVVNRLNREIVAFLQTRDLRDKLETLGVGVPSISTPEEFAGYIRAEIAKIQQHVGRELTHSPFEGKFYDAPA